MDDVAEDGECGGLWSLVNNDGLNSPYVINVVAC